MPKAPAKPVSTLITDLDSPEKRNALDLCDCMLMIEHAEADIPHDELPPHYDWVVRHRDLLLHQFNQTRNAIARATQG